MAFLRNTLVRLPEYRQSLAAVKVPFEDAGEPFDRLILLPTPDSSPAAADDGLSFTGQPLLSDGAKADWAGACSLTGEGKQVAIISSGREARVGDRIRLPFPGGPSSTPPSANGIIALDYDYDFKTDLVFAGAGGLRIYRQESDSRFVDVGSQTSVPAGVITAAYSAAWAADIDLDGDLDILLGNTDGAPTVLRNNGNGTFAVLHPFEGVTRLRGFAYADFDGDGDT